VTALPETLEEPDIGFVSASGVYVAIVFVASLISIGSGANWTSATIVGSVSTAGTVGLIVGALLARRLRGVPERLGQRRRQWFVLFVVPTLFGLCTVAVLLFSAVPTSMAVGTVFGALTSFVASLLMVSMVKTRYARAVTPGEPVVSIPYQPDQRLQLVAVAGSLTTIFLILQFGLGVSWSVGGGLLIFILISGFVAVLSYIDQQIDSGPTGGVLDRVLPNEQGATRFGQRLSMPSVDPGQNPGTLPTLEVYEHGILVHGGIETRFLPWEAISDIRLTEAHLCFVRPRWFNTRCAREVVDDVPERYEEIKRLSEGTTSDRGSYSPSSSTNSSARSR